MNRNLQIYSDNAIVYANKFDKWPRTNDIKRIFSFCLKQNPRVLELGCANGKDIKEILKSTNNYLGVDGAKGLLDIARGKYPKVNFLFEDFRNLCFADASYDIILDFASLFHLEKIELKAIIAKIYHWLDKNGLLLICAEKGNYQKIIKKDQDNKIQYLYQRKDILDTTKNQFEEIYFREENRFGLDWFTIILKKR